jgi:hypothetical protein
MSDLMTVKVDDAICRRNLNLYLQETSKTIEDAINFKLYDGCREALKQTPKADRSKVKQSLEQMSSKYPDRTVAEMVVIKQKQASGEEIIDLEADVKKLMGRRYSSIGFTKAGYLPGIKKLLQYVHKSFASVTGITRASFGGAEPATKTGSVIKGSFFNDVEGKINRGLVTKLKEEGAEAGLQKINSDIVTYLSKKLDIPAEHFNRS